MRLRSCDHSFNTTEEVMVIGLRAVAAPELTVQVAARQLQAQAQALGGGSLGVDPDQAGPHGSHQPELRRVVVLVPQEDLKTRMKEASTS